MKRHKCTVVRLLPLHLQPGAAPYPACHRWFTSRSGLAVHRVQIPDSQPPTTPAKRPPLTKRASVSARAAFAHPYVRCELRFSRLQDLKRHSPFCSLTHLRLPVWEWYALLGAQMFKCACVRVCVDSPASTENMIRGIMNTVMNHTPLLLSHVREVMLMKCSRDVVSKVSSSTKR